MVDHKNTRDQRPQERKQWQPLNQSFSSTSASRNNLDNSTMAPAASNGDLASTSSSQTSGIAGPTPPPAELLRRMRKLVHTEKQLQKGGYTLKQLDASDLEDKKKKEFCVRCGKSAKQPKEHPQWKLERDPSLAYAKFLPACSFHGGVLTGHGQWRKWTCCGGPPNGNTCQTAQDHLQREYAPGQLEAQWAFYPTPEPPRSTTRSAAVAIDCEMGTSATGDAELISVTAVDYFTGKVLLDSLVYPSVEMLHYNTRFTGLHKGHMENARRRGQCLLGRDAARNALFRFIGPDTIVIGHGAGGDFRCLRWIHGNIVDTHLVEQERRERAIEEIAKREAMESFDAMEAADMDDDSDEIEAGMGTLGVGTAQAGEVGKLPASGVNSSASSAAKPTGKRQPGGTSLKALVLERLGRAIQKGTHGSREDALATKDLLHWMITRAPEAQGL